MSFVSMSSCNIYLLYIFLTSETLFLISSDKTTIFISKQEVKPGNFNKSQKSVTFVIMLPLVPHPTWIIFYLLLILSFFYFYPLWFCWTRIIFSEVPYLLTLVYPNLSTQSSSIWIIDHEDMMLFCIILTIVQCLTYSLELV